MAKSAENNKQAKPNGDAEFQVSPEVLQMAKSCFAGADDAALRGSYDYAITLYLQGLRYAPDDVEHGHKPLYETAVRQKAAGKTKGWGSKTARMKANVLQMAGKKKDAFFEMEKAMAGNPDNHLELAALAQAAQSLDLPKTAVFFAERALEAGRRTGKLTESICVQMANIYENRGLYRQAMVTLQDAEVLDKSQSGRHMKRIRDLAARTTIGAGLEDAESFRERIKDATAASESEKQRVITAQDEFAARADELAKELEKTPNDVNLMVTVGDTYAQAERDEDALKYYRKARAASGGTDYRIKVKMDDLRMRQFRRDVRAVEEKLAADPNNEEVKSQRQELVDRRNRFEQEVFEERAAEYPTDMSVRYELGLRHYRLGNIDQAIGAFQLSTRDPKRKIASLNMLGKCFFQKKLYQEAAAQFRAAMESYEIQGDDTWKELRYNLGLTYEALRKMEHAADCYSQIVMSDFTYRDAAKRLQDVRARGEGEDQGMDVRMDDSI